MPRVVTTPVRRTKRDAQQRSSHGGGVRTAASVRAAAAAAAAQTSISAPLVKREPVPTPIPSAVSHPASPKSWRHPDELPYIRTGGRTWDDMTIMRFLTSNAFSVPPRSMNTLEPWVTIRCADGTDVFLPRGYRLPLLWVAKFQWTSVKLVLTAHAAILQREWDNTKFEILHIARLCAALFAKARALMDDGAIERGWRCPLFDRALRRYWYDWLIMRDEFVRDFWREFGEEEFQSDILKLAWGQWVLRGHKGFTLTKKEAAEGITAAEFMKGLIVDEEAETFEWNESAAAAAPPPAPKQKAVIPVVQKAAAAGRKPTPTSVVSFLVRPNNPFLGSLQKFAQAHQDTPSTNGDSANHTPAAASSNQESTPKSASPQQQQRTEDITMAMDVPDSADARAQGSPSREASSASNGTAPAQRISLPGERRRSQASGSGTGSPVDSENANTEHVLPATTPAGAHSNAAVPGTGPQITPTKMGSLAPGCTVFRGSGEGSQDAAEDGLEDRSQEEEETSEDDEKDHEMQDVQPTPTEDVEAKREMLDAVIPPGPSDADTDDFDDDDLQLLYPDPPSPAESSASRAGVRQSPASASESGSPSRSASPGPQLSSAHFPPASPEETRFPPVSPPQSEPRFSPASPSVLPPASTAVFLRGRSTSAHDYNRDADSSLLAGFLQSCGTLGEEMRALRAEVGQLRAELAAPTQGLEARVRGLEEHAPASRVPASAGPSSAGLRWAHPLQHLICADEPAPMDVDPPAHSPGSGTKYGAADVPPRSRKFNSASRFAGV